MSNEELKPCPFCGFHPSADDDDCIYPVTVDRKVWSLNCYESGGGCSAAVLGGSPEECIALWNRRAQLDAIQAARGEDLAVAAELRAELDAIREQEPAVRLELVENLKYGGMHIRQWDNIGRLGSGRHQLYAAPPAAQDASGLIELLSWLRGAINCNAENDTGRHGVWFSTKHPMIQRIDAALAAHRQAQQREGE